MRAGLQPPAWAVGDGGSGDHPHWLPSAWGPPGCRMLLPGEDREGFPCPQELWTVATEAVFLPLVWLIGLSGGGGARWNSLVSAPCSWRTSKIACVVLCNEFYFNQRDEACDVSSVGILQSAAAISRFQSSLY